MTYCFKCELCKITTEEIRSMKESGNPAYCPNCGKKMERDYAAEHTAVRGDYSQPLVMQSMGFHPKQLAEHRRLFPNIEVTKAPGGMYAPVARSLTEKRKVLRARGWTDRNAFVGES